MTSTIYLDTNPPLAEIILNRPGKRNALSVEMWSAIPDLIGQATNDPSVKVIILHGGDSGSFAAGADISEFSTIYATPESAAKSGKTIADALAAVEDCPKPVIAAIQGACVGGGVSLAMAADIRLSHPGARFGITPGKLGLVYPPSDTRRLLKAIGPGAAKDLLFTGKIIYAQRAQDIRLIDLLCDENEDILEFARAYAGEVCSVSQWSTRAIKTMIAGFEAGWTDSHPDAQALFLEGFANVDFQEGYSAFLEKRKAAFLFE